MSVAAWVYSPLAEMSHFYRSQSRLRGTMSLKNEGIVHASYPKAPPRHASVYCSGRPKKNFALISQTYFIAIFLPMVRFLHPVFIRGGCQTLKGCIVAPGKSLPNSLVTPSS